MNTNIQGDFQICITVPLKRYLTYIDGIIRFLMKRNQFTVLKSLIYCFKETIGFEKQASFLRCPISSLIKSNDITKEFLVKGYSNERNFSWIENYKLIWVVGVENIQFLALQNYWMVLNNHFCRTHPNGSVNANQIWGTDMYEMEVKLLIQQTFLW